MADTFSVYNTAIRVDATPYTQRKITNTSGGSLYYKTTSAVSTSDSSIAAGSSITIAQPYWLICANAAPANVLVDSVGYQNPSINEQPDFLQCWQPGAVAGNDTACTNGTIYVVKFTPDRPFKATGIGYQIGTTGGTDKVVATLFDAAGAVLAYSDTGGATVGTSSTSQALPFTSVSTYTVAPGVDYFAGVVFNGTTAKFYTLAAGSSQGNIAGTGTQTFGTPAAITAPSTFTANKGPLAYLY